jgi:hypothetical protein
MPPDFVDGQLAAAEVLRDGGRIVLPLVGVGAGGIVEIRRVGPHVFVAELRDVTAPLPVAAARALLAIRDGHRALGASLTFTINGAVYDVDADAKELH